MSNLSLQLGSARESFVITKIEVDKTITLRHTVLWPHKPISYVRLPEDDMGHHYATFSSESSIAPLAVISVFLEQPPGIHEPELSELNGKPAARFRKFACQPEYQGQGIGTSLLRHAFEAARAELACAVIWCDARVETKGWYERRGMRAFGNTFFKGDIEYVKMLSVL
ncbi:GCN5-related N-acetyltransferase [Cristinia sonorae]|uniref:GCN5-related N-acetyltransferase n=1 Tax=Cristinia sonorae TaxID=1940300 RepID=A0A8K0UEN5_9AGAR|nr:GCN5-related N-acetyltransferase [Cristinia sonorae]